MREPAEALVGTLFTGPRAGHGKVLHATVPHGTVPGAAHAIHVLWLTTRPYADPKSAPSQLEPACTSRRPTGLSARRRDSLIGSRRSAERPFCPGCSRPVMSVAARSNGFASGVGEGTTAVQLVIRVSRRVLNGRHLAAPQFSYGSIGGTRIAGPNEAPTNRGERVWLSIWTPYWHKRATR